MPTIQEIGELAVKSQQKDNALRKSYERYDQDKNSGRDPVSYDPERLAFLEASNALREACQAYINEQAANHAKEP